MGFEKQSFVDEYVPFLTIICRFVLNKASHSGTHLPLSFVQQLMLMRKIINYCAPCARMHPNTIQPIRCDLPNSSLEPEVPFCSTVAVHAFGPFKVRLSTRRNAATS